MGAADYIILGLLAVLVILAVRYMIKHRGKGCSGCSGCSGCNKSCPLAKNPTEKEDD